MPRLLYCLLCCIGIGAPVSVQASIVMSEVAWMGSVASPNHEWIELHNPTGAAVAVEGWTLADGNNLLITLAGTIPAGAYVVVERTSDDSAAGGAFLLYTGSLVNTGATLTLRTDGGQIVDQVVGGSDWALIGGDNATKATAQLVGSGWRTGAATPGAANTATALSPIEVDNNPVVTTTSTANNPTVTTASTVRRSSGGSETLPLQQATTELGLAIEAPTIAYERQLVPFSVTPSGIGRTIMQSLQYQWNFGDFTIATGSTATHRFLHPGTYLVTVNARFGRHDEVARHSITILPVSISVTRTDNAIVLHNDAVYDIDVSGFRVVAGKTELTLPPHSYLAAKQSVRLPQYLNVPIVIRDQRGGVVYQEVDEASPVVAVLAVPEPHTVSLQTTEYIVQRSPVPPAVIVPTVVAEGGSTTAVLRTESRSGEVISVTDVASPPSMPARWPYALLGLLLTVAVAAVLWPRGARHLST